MGKPTCIGVIVALVGILLGLRQALSTPPPERPPTVQGKKDTILMLVGNHPGFSNVHLATTFSLLQRHPSMDIHIATWPSRKSSIERVSEYSKTKKPATFHELRGLSYAQAMQNIGYEQGDITHAPGNPLFLDNIAKYMAPWPAQDHYDLFVQMRRLIDEIDPAVVVLDLLFLPALDAAREANRLRAIVTPNTLVDFFGGQQPKLQVFWRYPAMGSGIPYPVPWSKIPENVVLMLRFAWTLIKASFSDELLPFLRSKGIRDPVSFHTLHTPDMVWIAQELEGAALPIDYVPANVTAVGPIALSSAPIEEQDPELAAWLARGPTVLVNLGSAVKFYEDQATALAAGLATVLDRQPDVQVVWKFRKNPALGAYNDSFRAPLEKHIASGRMRLEKWFAADPTSILESGHVVANIHHGGGNCYHEALGAGVPQIVLPLWADLYNYATLVEYAGIGLWASRKTAPDFSAEEVSEALLRVVDGGKESVAMRDKARMFAEKGRAQGVGRDRAADILAELAGTGYSII